MSNKTSSSGLNTGGLLLAAFIVLKLTKVIDWSWWWVLSPLWIGGAIGLVVIIIWLIVIYRKHVKRKKEYKKRQENLENRPMSGFEKRLYEAQKLQQERRDNA